MSECFTDNNILAYITRHYPAVDNVSVTTTIVLVAGTNHDYAAYIGHGNPSWVRRFGDKLSFREAQHYFPEIVSEQYRR